MYLKLSCPHCGKVLKIKEEYLGRKTRCPYCRGAFELDASQMDDVAERTGHGVPGVPEQTTGGGAVGKRDGTNVNLLLTAVAGIGLTAAFYAVVVFPLRGTDFGMLFHQRGWVPYVIVLLAAWAASMLFFKMRKLAKQRQTLLFDALPTELSRQIRPDNARTFQRHIHALPHNFRDSFLLNRVYAALENFRARGSIQEVTSLLTSQADIDASTVQSSYTILKVFIWAIIPMSTLPVPGKWECTRSGFSGVSIKVQRLIVT